ncbi:MAG TPA: copper amine oxidase N-terminal domain-containing protein [Abditibacteriaceae bacterium]
MPYTFEGTSLEIGTEPQLQDGTLWVPLRSLGSALGGNVDWDPDNRVAILYLGGHIATVKIDDATVDVDGNLTTLRAAPYLSEGETWVPVRLFSEALGYNLNVDPGNKQVDLTSPV